VNLNRKVKTMARTTTVIQRTNRFTGAKDVVEIENKAASAGGDVNGRVYKQYLRKTIRYRYKLLGIRGTKGGRFVA
jgi:hypothetical protein